MSKVLISRSIMTNIANAIRSKTTLSGTIKPSQMADAISSIELSSGSTLGVFEDATDLPSLMPIVQAMHDDAEGEINYAGTVSIDNLPAASNLIYIQFDGFLAYNNFNKIPYHGNGVYTIVANNGVRPSVAVTMTIDGSNVAWQYSDIPSIAELTSLKFVKIK